MNHPSRQLNQARPGFRFKTPYPGRGLLTAALLAAAGLTQAGTFDADFNSGLPAGTIVTGNATNDLIGGYTNSGCIKLTTAVNSLSGNFVITSDLDPGVAPVGFIAKFKALIGGGNAADGMSFNFAPDVPLNNSITEEGGGTGFTVSFDTYSNANDTVGIELKAGGGSYASYSTINLRQNAFVDVLVHFKPNGNADVIYDGVYALTNVYTGYTFGTGNLIGWGARTGGQNDNHFIDDVSISTYTNQVPFVDYFAPIGRGARPDAPIHIVLNDLNSQVDRGSIQLKLDGVTVTPIVSGTAPTTDISFQPPSLFASNSTHTVSLTFADNATPVPNPGSWSYKFTVAGYSALDTNLAADVSFANLATPGFATRYSQIADAGSREITRAELQLANLLIDGSSGLPYTNLAAPNPNDNSFNYYEPNVINYAYPQADQGSIPGDLAMPGLPGPTVGTGSSYAFDAVTYLHFTPGFYALGVNSSDGFKLAIADGADIFAPTEAIFRDVRAAADSTVVFSVAADGYYPFRLVYFTGDPLYAPGPGTVLPSLEFFSIDKYGNRSLVNDTNVAGYVPAFTPAKTRPYVRAVSPAVNDSGVPGNSSVSATLVDGSLTLQTNTIVLQINGATVTPVISRTGAVSTVTYQPTLAFGAGASNYVTIAYTDSGSNRRTNAWSFSVANVMSPIWSLPAVNNTWVTAGSTERGLAYNPKTGHLLLVSRAATPAPAAGLGIAILDSSNGNVLGTMDVSVASSGPGTFKLNLIDVADDGVIYACNLSTSAAQNFRIYRWQNETAPGVVVYDAAPTAAAGTPRWGDDFRLRGSGAGTQIIVSGNNASANSLPIFTTTDGTNFTRTLLAPTGLANNVVRLGLAWACGNAFYGDTTSTPMSYVGFSGPPSTAAILTASYGIYDKNTNQAIGPIGLDIVNQRLIGNQTVAPHNINLYDQTTLLPTPARNFPIDQRNYASQNTSFGTGFIDFTPDGSRVFCLDTGNGIIAFSLTPKVGAPSICAQPQTNVVAGPGALGFMDVTAIGAPQKFQWRLNGNPIPNATNRTLDIPNVQPGNLGFYSVIITNASLGLSVTSTPAPLDTLMVFTNPPTSQIVALGATATFTAGVSNGLPAYTYQWKFNGVNLSNATSSAYSIANAQVTNAGTYAVTVTDSLGQTITSPDAVLTVGTLGTGTGLTGDYYSQFQTFLGTPTLTRVDPTINFEFGTAAPDASLPADLFSVRWYGQVQPFYSQNYTFYTVTDDGVRLWINGQLVVDSWINQAPTEHSGTIALTANQKYDIMMEYFENTGGATAKLSWSSAAQTKGIVPQTQLYPGTPPVQPLVHATISNGTNFVLNWNGTFLLQSATNVEGPYVTIDGITNSPYSEVIGAEPQKFLRLLVP